MERPVLEFDGRRYQRQGGKWLDGYLTVPLTMSQKLDARAKEDPEFLDRCRQQDFDDDPRKRGIRLSAELAAELGFDDPPTHSANPIPGYQSTGTGSGPRHHYGLQSVFKKDGSLVMTCDIEKGWRETERSWCFRASDTSPLQAEGEIRATVAIIEDTVGPFRRRYTSVSDALEAPESCPTLDSVAPRFVTAEKPSGAITLVLNEYRCTLTIRLFDSPGTLNGQLPWNDSVRSTFAWAESAFYEQSVRLPEEHAGVSRPFRVSLDARLHDRSTPSDG
jgi:hypothetical protein